MKTQVGGSHYKNLKIPPFKYSYENNLDCYQHTAIKYITRFRDKKGKQDLEKAVDTLNQLIAVEYLEPKGKAIPSEYETLEEIIRQIKRSDKSYDRIVTIGRGGLWAAANLGYALGITQVETMTAKNIRQLSSDNILFVDGVVDTGATLQSIIIDSAVLYCRQSTKVFPTYMGELIKGKDSFIKLPISQYMDKENI